MTRLYLIRHAPARDRDPSRWPDDALRPLSPDGRRKMLAAARGMRALALRPGLILSSPLVRAAQTAELLAREMGRHAPVEMVNWLRPEGPADEAVRSLSRSREARITLVGHEPHLSSLTALLAGWSSGVPWKLKKGGLCELEFPGRVGPGQGRWSLLLAPRLLRAAGLRRSGS